MFDPRGDADALFKFHGVHIGNPFDLQVMDIAIRSCSAGSPTRPLCPTRCRSCTDTIASYLFAAPGAKPTLGVFRALQAIGKKVFEAQDAWVWHRDVIPEPLVLYAVSDVKFLHDLSFAMRRRLKQMANEHLTHYDNQVKLVSKERVALATIAPTHTTALAMRNHPDLNALGDSSFIGCCYLRVSRSFGARVLSAVVICAFRGVLALEFYRLLLLDHFAEFWRSSFIGCCYWTISTQLHISDILTTGEIRAFCTYIPHAQRGSHQPALS
jgi:hypothetical protein